MGERGKNYAFWLSFFRGAGIMSPYDTKYALAFDENRIQPDMLLDLNKEYLREMEITAMGDIIAILKHAKRAYEESKTMAFEKSKPPQLPQKSSPAPSEPPTKNLPAIRPSVSINVTASEKVTTTTPTVINSTTTAQKPMDKAASSTVVKLNPVSKIVVPNPIKDSPTGSGNKASTTTRTFIIPNKESSSDSESSMNGTPSPQKVREIDNSGTSLRVRVTDSDGKPDKAQALFKSRLGPSLEDKRENEAHSSEKRNIFDRLGESSTSKVSSSSTVQRVQCISMSPSPSPDSKTRELSHSDSKNSVFGRLGGRDRYQRSRSRSPIHSRERDSFHRRDDKQFYARDERNRSPIGRRTAPPLKENDYVGAVKRVTIGGSEPRRSSYGSSYGSKLYSDEISRESTRSRIGEPFRRSSEISSTSRFRSEAEPSRDRQAVKSRLGGGSSSSINDEPMRTRTKIISSKVISKNTLPKNVKVGQVLRSTKYTRPDGSSAVKKFVVKSISKK